MRPICNRLPRGLETGPPGGYPPVSISIAAFGLLHFVYPTFAPGIPPMRTSIIFPLPGHSFWVYLSAAYRELVEGSWNRRRLLGSMWDEIVPSRGR